MPKLEQWELLGLLLASGASAFGLFYATSGSSTLVLTLRGPVTFSLSPESAVGLAGFTLTILGSLAAIVTGQFKPAGSEIGASLIIWTDFIMLLFGDVLFYAGYLEGTVIVVGLVSAALTTLGLLVISGRSRAIAASN